MEVTFTDGEVLVGTTTGYDAQRPGLFLSPVDGQSNNARIFIVQAVVKQVEFIQPLQHLSQSLSAWYRQGMGA